jgi:hypothetical protein
MCKTTAKSSFFFLVILACGYAPVTTCLSTNVKFRNMSNASDTYVGTAIRTAKKRVSSSLEGTTGNVVFKLNFRESAGKLGVGEGKSKGITTE